MEAIQDLLRRMDIVEGSITFQGNNGHPRSLTQSFIDLETWALPLLNRPPLTVETVEMLIDAKLRTAIQGVQSVEKSYSVSKPVLESKAIQEIGKLNDAKSY